MIQQTRIGLASRELANPYDKDGFLPLITAPMSSVVDENNYVEFQNANIHLCFARTVDMDKVGDYTWKSSFHAVSLNDFIEEFVVNTRPLTYTPTYRCIDTANGNIPQLHEAIRKAKEIHGSNLVIMAGNVSSTQAFKELAETGVDYIRVGIGGGGGCNTTANTGVGQEDLEKLIYYCKNQVDSAKFEKGHWERQVVFEEEFEIDSKKNEKNLNEYKNHLKNTTNISNVKIVADGISSYIKQCESKYGFNDNGYAAINKLLFAGADLVMIGGLFAQCVESAGQKALSADNCKNDILEIKSLENFKYAMQDGDVYVKYSGMSTQEEQKKYRKTIFSGDVDKGNTGKESVELIKPSEGSVKWIPVRWTLKEWLLGSDNQDQYPYLMGWVNSIKSAMAYCNKICL